MNVRYRVELSQDERDELSALPSGGKHAARKLKRAQILLAADAGASDEDIAISIAVGGSTVYRTKRRFVEDNLEAALSEEPRRRAECKFSGKEEALLVATACSNPPEGRAPTVGLRRRPEPRAVRGDFLVELRGFKPIAITASAEGIRLGPFGSVRASLRPLSAPIDRSGETFTLISELAASALRFRRR